LLYISDVICRWRLLRSGAGRLLLTTSLASPGCLCCKRHPKMEKLFFFAARGVFSSPRIFTGVSVRAFSGFGLGLCMQHTLVRKRTGGSFGSRCAHVHHCWASPLASWPRIHCSAGGFFILQLRTQAGIPLGWVFVSRNLWLPLGLALTAFPGRTVPAYFTCLGPVLLHTHCFTQCHPDAEGWGGWVSLFAVDRTY
jgi:hypothetical protein